MKSYNTLTKEYLKTCQEQKGLSSHTIRAYQSDLQQFGDYILSTALAAVSPKILDKYIVSLHSKYKASITGCRYSTN